jgi:hypothetical protein
MFIGHAAAGLAARRAHQRVPLVVLLLAPWFLDLLWPVFLLLGWERVRIDPGNTAFSALDFVSYPWSHSLLMALAWGALAGWAWARWRRDRAAGVLVGALVASHWFFDLVVHRADLPLAPGLPWKVGLGLWNSVPGTIALEGGLYVLGVALYAAATRAKNLWGHVALWSLVLALAGIYAADAASAAPPPGPAAIAWTMIVFGFVVAAWAAWIDRTTEPRQSRSA